MTNTFWDECKRVVGCSNAIGSVCRVLYPNIIMQHSYISIRYTQYSSWYICILLDCSGMDVTIKILFKKSVVIYCWVLDHEEVKVGVWRDGHTIYLKSPARIPHKKCVHIFLFSSMLHVQPLIILTVWMKVHVCFIHCFHFYVGCEATKLLHIRPLQTPVLQCSSFILHDAFHNLFLSWSEFFSWALFLQFRIQASVGILSWFVLFIPTTFPYYFIVITLISKIFIFKNSLFISCSLV
jgi:hypothetical protein